MGRDDKTKELPSMTATAEKMRAKKEARDIANAARTIARYCL